MQAGRQGEDRKGKEKEKFKEAVRKASRPLKKKKYVWS